MNPEYFQWKFDMARLVVEPVDPKDAPLMFIPYAKTTMGNSY